MSELSNFIQPENEPIYHKIKLLDDRSIGIIGWKMKQEKELLFAIETKPDDQKFIIDKIIELSRSCVDKKEFFDTLSRNNILKIITEQRKLAKGENIEVTFRCINPNCADYNSASQMGGIPNTENVSLDNDLTIEPFKNEPITIDKFTFIMGECPYSIQRKLEEKYLTNLELNKFNYYLFLNSIKEIQVPGKEGGNLSIKDFEIPEVESILEQMDTTEYERLVEKFIDNMSGFSVEKEMICPTCRDAQPLQYDDIFGLLVF